MCMTWRSVRRVYCTQKLLRLILFQIPNETTLLQNEKYVPNQVQSAFITKAYIHKCIL